MKENETIEEMPVIEEKRFFTKKRLIAGGTAAAVIAALSGAALFLLKGEPEIKAIEVEDTDES